MTVNRRTTSSIRTIANRCARLAWIAAFVAAPIAVGAQINLWTNRYDQDRTGANLLETTLTAANVNATQFGRLYSYPVDGPVYAQPLYMSGVTVNGVRRNLLYVATMDDKLYAFDADSSSPTPLWKVDFTNPPSVTAIPITHILPANGGNIIGNVGIQSTPVIDQATQTMYLVVRTEENGKFVQRLHALDITTGLKRSGSPVVIAGSVPGTGPDATLSGGTSIVTFDPKMHMQRAALALTNGVVLVSWATHEDIKPSRGWIMGFDATTLVRVGIFAVDPDYDLGGIWQGGRAPTVDPAGHAYFATGNGKWDGARNFGDSLLKFQVARSGFTLVDYFTPWNQLTLREADLDLSGSGFMRIPGIPGKDLLLGGGKEGVLYLLDAANLGHQPTDAKQIVQLIPVNGGHVMGGPVYWNSDTAGPLIYNWSELDVLLAYRVGSDGRLVTPPYASGHVMSPSHPGGSLTVSANGSGAGTGIVWASIPTPPDQDAKHHKAPGTVRAFNAETLAEIWNSDMKGSQDRLGNLMKFVPPTVANGKVFVPNHDGQVRVYGLLPSQSPQGPGDAYVEGGTSAGLNFGSATELLAKRSTADDFTRISYMKFDISSIGSTSRVLLRLTGHLSSTGDASVKTAIYSVTDTSWAENTLTWNVKPALGPLLGTFTVSTTTPQTFDVDVTTLVKAEQTAGHQFISVAASNPDVTKAYVSFNSRESGSGGPALVPEPDGRSSSGDAYVQGGATASTNFGVAPELLIKFGNSPDTTRQTYLKLDLGSATTTVGRATLRVFGRLSSSNSSNVAATLFGIDDTSWDQSTITWNNKPAAGAVLGAITVPDTTARWFDVDVTDYVRGQAAAGRRVVGFRFAAPVQTSAYVSLNSLEAPTNRPQLIVDGVSGAGGRQDAYVRGGTYAANNFAADPELLVKLGASTSTTRESYLKFDVPAASVTSAVVRLYGHVATPDDPQIVTTAYGVPSTTWQASTLTWNNRPTGGANLGTVKVVGTTPAWVQLDVTAYVNAEIAAGRRTITLALRNVATSVTWTTFNSAEAAANRPELVIK